jgi:EmrB/QacA subfamily drug resistance transporter
MGLPDGAAMTRSRWLALAVLCAVTMMIILDGTIVTVALPAIQRDLGFSATGLEWVVNGYLIAFGGLLLLAGRLGDLAGGKRVFLAGLILFTLASLACGFATSQPMLVAARFVQGAGGATASAVSLGMIIRLFSAPRERAKAMGVYSFTGAGGASLGLVLGGVLTEALSWHWIFFVNVPFGLLAAAAGWYLLDDFAGIGVRAGADAVGAMLVTTGLMLGVYAIAGTTRYGWGSARTLLIAGGAVMLLAGFVARQRRARTPLLPLRVFGVRDVSVANAVQALTVAAAFGFQVLIPQYMQRVLGYGPAAAGVAMLPAAVVIAVLSVGVSARLNARFGPRAMLAGGLVPVAAGLALLVRVPVSGGYPAYLLPTMLLVGGFGLAFPAMITLAMSAASASDAGVTSGLVNTTQQVGAALGVAVLSTLAAARTGSQVAGGTATLEALTAGYRLAFGVGAGLAIAALLVAVVAFLPPTRRLRCLYGWQCRRFERRARGEPAAAGSQAPAPHPHDEGADRGTHWAGTPDPLPGRGRLPARAGTGLPEAVAARSARDRHDRDLESLCGRSAGHRGGTCSPVA